MVDMGQRRPSWPGLTWPRLSTKGMQDRLDDIAKGKPLSDLEHLLWREGAPAYDVDGAEDGDDKKSEAASSDDE